MLYGEPSSHELQPRLICLQNDLVIALKN